MLVEKEQRRRSEYQEQGFHIQQKLEIQQKEQRVPRRTLFIGVAAILLYLASVGIYYFESDDQPEDFGSVLHCLWWAVATLTTVGYGDVYPITMGGRIFTFFILLIGLGVISVPAGLVASALAKARQMEEDS